MPDSSSSGEAQGADVKALAELDHPMHYTNSAFKEQRPTNSDERQAYLYDRRMIEDLISEYNYRVDSSLAKSPDYGVLGNLFADNAVVAFPHGKHLGNAGLGEWLLSPVSAFHRMSVSEALSLICCLRIDIVFSTCPRTTASSSNLILWRTGVRRGSQRRGFIQQMLVRSSSRAAITTGRSARSTRNGRYCTSFLT